MGWENNSTFIILLLYRSFSCKRKSTCMCRIYKIWIFLMTFCKPYEIIDDWIHMPTLAKIKPVAFAFQTM